MIVESNMIRNALSLLALAALIQGFVIDGDDRGGWVVEEDLTLDDVISETKIKMAELEAKSEQQKLALVQNLKNVRQYTKEIRVNAENTVSDHILTLLNTVDTALNGNKIIDTCVNNQHIAIKNLDRTPLTLCKHLDAFDYHIAQYVKLEKSIASVTTYCMTSESKGPKILQECIQNRLDVVEKELKALENSITNDIRAAQYNSLYCLQNALNQVVLSVKNINVDFQRCVEANPVVTIEELIDELKPSMNEMKSKVRELVSEGTKQTATLTNNIENAVSSAVLSVAQQMTKISIAANIDSVSGNEAFKVCQLVQKDAIDGVDRSALHQCRTSSKLNQISSKLYAITQLEAKIGGIAGKCIYLKGEAITPIKMCMVQLLSESEQEIVKVQNEISELYVQALTDAINCANTEALSIITQVESIMEQWNTCVEKTVDYTVEEIIDELKPAIAKIKQNIKQTTTEISNEIAAINEHINAAISEPKTILAQRFEDLQTNLYKHIESDIHVPECVSRHEVLIASAKSEMASIDLCRTSSHLGGISSKVGEMKKIEATISAAPGECVAKIGNNPAGIKECIVEAMHVSRVQMNKLVQEVNGNVRQIKTESSKCITQASQLVWKSILGLTNEFELCVQKNQGRTVEDIIDELTPAMKELKEKIRETATELTNRIETVNQHINEAIAQPKVVLNEKFHEITSLLTKHVESELHAPNCVSKHESLVNSAKSDMSAIDLCRASANLQGISGKIAEMKKIEATISAAPGNCVAKEKTNSAKVRECILDAMHVARVQMNNLVQATEAAFNNIKDETTRCSSEAAQIVWKSILGLTQEFNLCLQIHVDGTVEQVLDELTPAINQLKSQIKETSTKVADEIVMIHEHINSVVSQPKHMLNQEFEKLNLVVIKHMESDSYVPECVSRQESLVASARSEMDSIELCRSSSQLSSISGKLAEMKKIEATISGTPGACVSQVGGDAEKVKECIQEAIHITRVEMQKMTQGIDVAINQIKSESSRCVSQAAQIVFKSISELSREFETCVQKHSSFTVEQVIDQLTPAMNDLKSKISGTASELSIEVINVNSYINSVVSESKVLLNEKFEDMALILTEHVGSENHVPECVSRHQSLTSQAKSEMAAIDLCRKSSALETVISKIGEMKKIEATISASSGNCVAQVGTNSARVKLCIQEAMHIATVQINEIVQSIDVTIRNVKIDVSRCTSQSAHIVWNSILGLTGEFDICIQKHTDITIENIIDELNPVIDELKTQIAATVSELSVEIIATNQYINSEVSKPKSILNEKFSEITSMTAKHVESESYTPECVSRQESLVHRAQSEMAAIDACRSSPALNDIVATVGEMNKIQVTISSKPGSCVAEVGIDSVKVKECIQEAIHVARVQMNNMVKGTDAAIAQIKQDSTRCATAAAQTVWKSILGLTSEFEHCVQKYQSITVEEIIDAMNPEINEIKSQLKATYVEFSNKIASTTNFVNAVVSAPKTVINKKFAELDSTIKTKVEGKKYIAECVSRQEMLVSGAQSEMAAIDLCRSSPALNTVISKIGEIKKVEASISGVSGACVVQVGTNSNRVKLCIEEALHVTKVQMNKLVQDINKTISQIKSESQRCVSQATHIVYKSLIATSNDFEICVQKSPIWTVEQVIDEVKPSINEMKSTLQQTISELTGKIQTASKNVHEVVKSAKNSVENRLASSTLAVTSERISPCLTKAQTSISSLNTEIIETCRLSPKLNFASLAVSDLAKMQSAIGASTGKCVSTEGTAPTKVKLCIDAVLESVQNQLASAEKSVSTAVLASVTETINCSNTNGQKIVQALDEVIAHYNSCVDVAI